MEKELFHITVEVRHKNHEKVHFSQNVKINDLKFEWEIINNGMKYSVLEAKMKHLHKTLNQINPKYIYNIDASIFNTISKTYMSMAGFYGAENRFVKFT